MSDIATNPERSSNNNNRHHIRARKHRTMVEDSPRKPYVSSNKAAFARRF
ncbi:hypothetical protein NC653_002363 [Populus alba x Populus x berolinensis]|uniref:Uncharacterized protein n=1 Tax=Populus alba x Populus x berolinensis TaxID=444605 RepID=A0AAD6RPV5_9ROSI|nr:hypothetical protein NC653_002363 [Populus alba x Populus x berolinensis]